MSTEVIDVDAASTPMLQQIMTALQAQTASQKQQLDKANGIFQEVQVAVREKLGAVEEKVAALERGKEETTVALLEQKDSILWDPRHLPHTTYHSCNQPN